MPSPGSFLGSCRQAVRPLAPEPACHPVCSHLPLKGLWTGPEADSPLCFQSLVKAPSTKASWVVSSLPFCFAWFSASPSLMSQELLLAFQKEAQFTMCPRLLLSAAVSGDPQIIQMAYDVPRLGT